ncbi:MAG TPA: class I SAM-dependent methyltransferase [Parachlamydiaceae bacterium]|nr:class I SAM-dependent methyltransferase [Parachlamydiaceae bacterium]
MKLELPDISDGEDKSSPLKNRIRKNYRHVKKWAKRTLTNCFRIYDREIREYPLAIDYYDGRFCVHYFANPRDGDEPPDEMAEEAVGAICSIFNAKPDDIYWRTRIRREKRQQYEKAGETNEFFTVLEYGVKFKVNLLDYLDTGLFLDHRETRKIIASESKDKRLLNLFAYTCSFSVHAAAAGSLYTKSVDMSNTYTEWGKENFKLNDLSLQNNDVVRADCLKFLDEEIRSGKKYDLIIVDPPTISRSKKMDVMFDIQYDYVFLLTKSLALLTPGGVIFFSSNSRKFAFDESVFDQCKIKEISYKTLPIDFHDPKIHRCWKITKQL